MILLRLFMAGIIILLLRWLFFKLYNYYLQKKFESESKSTPSPNSLDSVMEKAEKNLEEREQIRGVTDKTQETINNIKEKLK